MSSITDKPINSISEDLLKVETYSRALTNFIVSSDTPITIGLQGEWGTGKTSLMAILQEELLRQELATSWVNTWEYSIFRNSAETTPRILNGMLEKLELNCRVQGLWDIGDEINQNLRRVSKFLGNLANQVIKSQVDIDVSEALSDEYNSSKSADISFIKGEISNIIGRLISSPSNPYKKVVFFVDDLDRIPPTDAVQVLEALKNIFDIPNCVFILAIDYEVVVKGLESKFGVKTDKNEREFRSFFDKIIQVPFSMPIGTYNIESFLMAKLKEIGVNIDSEKSEYYTKIVHYTIGSNPRSLKRYLNSFSLINSVRALQKESEEESTDDLMLFALLGIQISYPQIFRLFTKEPNYLDWNKGFANKNGIIWETIQEKLAIFQDNELVDEEWEQVLWGLCQKESYLSSRAFDILTLFNFLRTKFSDSLHEEIAKALEFASITSVEDDIESKQATQKSFKKIQFDGLDAKIAQMNELGLNKQGIESFTVLFKPLYDLLPKYPELVISLAKTATTFNDKSLEIVVHRQLIYVVNPKKSTVGMEIFVNEYSGIYEHMLAYVEKFNLSEEYVRIEHNNDPNKRGYNRPKSLIFSYKLASKLGQEKYNKLLEHIATNLVNVIESRHA